MATSEPCGYMLAYGHSSIRKCLTEKSYVNNYEIGGMGYNWYLGVFCCIGGMV